MVKPFVLGDNEVTKTMDAAVIDNEGEDEDSIVSKAYMHGLKSKEFVYMILTKEQCFGFMEHTCN